LKKKITLLLIKKIIVDITKTITTKDIHCKKK